MCLCLVLLHNLHNGFVPTAEHPLEARILGKCQTASEQASIFP